MKEYTKGAFATISAYILWGLLPVYWKSVQAVSPDRMIAHRIIWSFMFLFMLLLVRRQLPQIKITISIPGQLKILTAASVILTLNWLTFIYAVSSGQVIAGSLGYYMSPLLSIALGVIYYKEKFKTSQILAIGLAAAGVIVITVSAGKFPWLSLILALTFGLYGLLKKKTLADSAAGLVIETGLIAPLALLYLIIMPAPGLVSVSEAASGPSMPQAGSLWLMILVSLAGIVTAVPLMLFSYGARKLDLSMIGFMQYIAPTLMLVLGVFAYDEPFTVAHAICFTLIWSGLILYTSTWFRFKPGTRQPAGSKDS